MGIFRRYQQQQAIQRLSEMRDLKLDRQVTGPTIQLAQEWVASEIADRNRMENIAAGFTAGVAGLAGILLMIFWPIGGVYATFWSFRKAKDAQGCLASGAFVFLGLVCVATWVIACVVGFFILQYIAL